MGKKPEQAKKDNANIQNATLKEAAFDIFTSYGRNVFNPFLAGPSPKQKIDFSLSNDYEQNSQKLRELAAQINISSIQKAAAKKRSEVSSSLAYRHSIVPKFVSDRYLEQTTADEVDAIENIQLQLSWGNYQSDINNLQINYSIQNECSQKLYEITQENNRWKASLFDKVFDFGMSKLFSVI